MSSPPPPTFKKRKPKLNAASSSSAAAAPASSAAPTAASDNEEEGPAVVVRSRTAARSNGAAIFQAGSAAAARRAKASKALSFADDEEAAGAAAQDGESSISSIKRSFLSQGAPRLLPTAAPLASSSSATGAAYSPAALAALKAATPTRSKLPPDTLDADGDVSMASNTAPSYAEELIPSAARVQEMKERRRRAAANGASASAGGGGEDFISLGSGGGGSYAGPHPHSTLHREEDILGDGADEDAAYTGALERVALGDEARARDARETKAQRRRAIEELELGRGSESEESAEEWEREQLQKMGLAVPGIAREASPYRAAAIPAISVLPSLTSASTRLSIRLVELDEAVKAHTQVRDDAARGLAQLEDEEAMNKQDVERAGEAEAWFRELESFILAVATFLENKTPALEAVEKAATATLAERTRLLQRARLSAATDELSLFYGVPSVSLLPPGVSDDGISVPEPSPAEEGDALSALRMARRAAQQSDALSPADQAAFDAAWSRLALQLEALFEDVAAPEFRSPAAAHPASLVSRFAAWRQLYADEYAGAWGGLALASAWEFWVRKEMGAWDALRDAAGNAGVASGPQGLDGFEWHAQLGAYAENGPEPPVGGDEEAVGNVVSAVVVPLLVKRAEAGAYDVWSESETRGAIELVEQVGYVLERTGARFQSLISAHLAPFRAHITSLHTALSTPPSHAAPTMHPLSAPSRISFLRRLLLLLRNLARWNRYVTPPERPAYAQLADTLVGAVMWPLLVAARETGGRDVAREVMGAVPPSLLAKDVGGRLSGFASGAQ